VGTLGRRGQRGEDAHARRAVGKRGQGMRLGAAWRGTLGRLARRRWLRWALGLRGAGLARLATRLGRGALGWRGWGERHSAARGGPATRPKRRGKGGEAREGLGGPRGRAQAVERGWAFPHFSLFLALVFYFIFYAIFF
jgi:hypothetical protein